MQPTAIQPLTTLNISSFVEFVDGKIKDTLGCYPVGNASTFIVQTILKQYGLNAIEDIESWGAKVYYADGGSLSDAWADRHIAIQMPKTFNRIQYYGRGPVENYIDRKDSEFLGIYANEVQKEYFDYIRPQESGNHTDVRWFSVLDKEGKGLCFYSNAPMEASALPYTTDQLDDGMRKEKAWGHHSGDLIPSGMTSVHIQKRQIGLACVNSWGAWPRKEYRMPYQDYDFTFAIKPVK